MRRLVLLLPLFACAPGTVPVADDDDATEASELGWEAAAPDVPDGSRLYGTLTCAVLAGPTEKAWQKQGDGWNEIPGFEGEVLPGLEVCLTDSPRTLQWDADGSITFVAGGWEHRLAPTEIEDRWVGETEPVDEPSDGCRLNLAESALELPIALSFDRTDLIEPGGGRR